jgi:adenosylcobinamide-phosphate synthase
MIVGRETDRLDEEGVRRAAVETVAENLVDGIVAPLFYAVIGGGPLAMAYKMVNTLDSMIGYKNERYRDFGKAAARFDDLANWLPARLTVPLVALAAAFSMGAGDRRSPWHGGTDRSTPARTPVCRKRRLPVCWRFVWEGRTAIMA